VIIVSYQRTLRHTGGVCTLSAARRGRSTISRQLNLNTSSSV